MSVDVPKKNPWPLRLVLLAILLVMLLAFGWDWWARKQCNAAWERVSRLHQEMIAQPGSATCGPEEVRKAIGWRSRTGKPVAKDHYYEEVYQLRRGLPWQTYYLCIIYEDVDGQPVYYAPFQQRMPESREVPTEPLQYEDLLRKSGFELEEPEGEADEPENGDVAPEPVGGEENGQAVPVDDGSEEADAT